jgi:hypothetical protein
MEVLFGAVVGGLISLATTLAVDVLRGRRELQHRWDADALAAVEHFIEVANRAIGALYDEGRARDRRPNEVDEIATLDRVSRGHMDAFRVAHARARLMTGALALQLGSYGAALSKLKVFADDGFPPDERVWKECQASLVEELDALIVKAGEVLQLRGA